MGKEPKSHIRYAHTRREEGKCGKKNVCSTIIERLCPEKGTVSAEIRTTRRGITVFLRGGCATVRERERQRRRERQEAWDRRNLRTVSTHLTRQEADALDVICCINRVTKYDLLHGFLLDYLEENGVPVRRWKKEGQRWP